MMPVHAVIIAGGRGERLGGVRKADLRLGGRRLVDRVADELGPLASPLMLSVGPHDDGRGERTGSIRVTDLMAPVGGPLAGLAAAVASLKTRGIEDGVLISVAVDTPFLPGDFCTVMVEAMGDGDAAFAAWGDDFYPPNAAWRLAALAALPEEVMQGRAPKSLKALLERLRARRADWTGRSARNPFANVNTPADLVALGHMARR
ncbi:molybdenum cofactor guanylyltransferase [Devosia sp. XGJD_8]|uniref:molybdenum cofactor guanylyltransferase n=1 Tax=Devosia sp. XGJD_8 TaxID=3391187 RepID=UPI003984C32E